MGVDLFAQSGGAAGALGRNDMLTRRHIVYAGAAGLGLAAFRLARPHAATAATHPYEVTHTDAEWRKLLTPAQYNILREEGTELPFTSALLEEHRAGTFSCAGCDLPLFSSKMKFESGTGWPSFWAPIPNAVDETEDHAFGMTRTRCRATAAAAISVMCSPTDRSPPVCATA